LSNDIKQSNLVQATDELHTGELDPEINQESNTLKDVKFNEEFTNQQLYTFDKEKLKKLSERLEATLKEFIKSNEAMVAFALHLKQMLEKQPDSASYYSLDKIANKLTELKGKLVEEQLELNELNNRLLAKNLKKQQLSKAYANLLVKVSAYKDKNTGTTKSSGNWNEKGVFVYQSAVLIILLLCALFLLIFLFLKKIYA